MTLNDHRISVRRTARYVTLGDGHVVDEVWFVLHGYSQLARHFIRWFEPALRPGRLIVAPEALSRSYFEGASGARRIGASWMTKEDREAEIDDYVHYFDQVADEILRDLMPTPRVEVHGFSQGGAAAARWMTNGRHAIDRLVVWGSPLPPDLDIERLRSNLKSTPLVLALGDRDHYIHQDQMHAELARLRELRLPVQFEPFAGGHKVDSETLLRLGAGVESA